ATALLGAANFTGTADENTTSIQVYRGTVGAGFGAASTLGSPISVTGAFDEDVGEEGTELITNGAFTTDGTGWTVGTNWTVSAGVASHSAGAGGNMDQAQARSGTLRIGLDLTRSAGSVEVRAVGDSTNGSGNLTAEQTHLLTLTAPANMHT